MIPLAGQPNGQGAPLSAQSGSMGGVGGPSASPAGGTPKRMARQRAPQTFAGMQQMGMARPSPQLAEAQANANRLAQITAQQQAAAPQQGVAPTAESSLAAAQQTVSNAAAGRNLGMFQRSGAVDALGQPLMQSVMQMLQDPTQGLNEAAQSNFDRQNRVLGREFGDLRNNLNENMAARGLDASTIAATRLGELGARQAEAQADLAARIQEGLIRDRSSAMSNAINAALGLRGQEADIGQSEYVINRDTGELEFRRNMDAARMAQDASQFDRRLGLDTELGRGNLALNQQQLGLARDRFGFEQATDARNFDRQLDRDRIGDSQFDRRFDFDISRDARDFNRLTDRDRIGDQQWQSAFDRQDTWRAEDNAYRAGRDVIGDRQWQDSFDRQGNWRAEDNQYRDRRDTVNDTRWDQSWQRDDTRWNQTQTNQQNALMMQVLSGLGFNNISPEILQQYLTSMGINIPTGRPSTVSSPGGF